MNRISLRLVSAISIASISVLSSVLVSAASITPGTPSQVAQLVAQSKNIVVLPAATAAQLPTAAGDFSNSNYPALGPVTPSTCLTATACVYGDVASSTTIVLFGDSHALMWLPAIVPLAVTHHEKVVLLWQGACPPGQLSIYFPQYNYPTVCNMFRKKSIGIIQTLKPKAVLLVGASSQVIPAANKHFTDFEWKTGLIKTIKLLKTKATKIVVIEDNVTFNSSVPDCLASFPTSIQNCAVAFPNPKYRGLQIGEKAAAKATSSLYVKTQDWLCTTKCAPVIGTMIPYVDTNHLSFTYASYLSKVMGLALKPIL